MNRKLILKELSRYNIGTYADIIYRNALLNKDRIAFAYGTERVTFADFNARVNRLVHALYSMGLKKGDGIGLLSWNCLECTDVVGAAMKGGFVVSPFNPRMQAEELDYLINYSEVKALFVGPELVQVIDQLRPRLPRVAHYVSLEREAPGMLFHNQLLAGSPSEEPDVAVNEDDPFIIFYTSGTTGVPRGAVYTHYRKLEEARTKALTIGMQKENKHVMILPLFHIGGWSHFWAFYCVGASNIIMTQRSFDAAATIRMLQDEKATDIHIVPTHLVSMLAVPNIEAYDLASVNRIWYAASPMPLELLRQGIDRFGPIFAQGYGQTESGPDIAILSRESHDLLDKTPEEQKVLASCGQPCLWVHARIVDDDHHDVEPYVVGDIIVQSKSVMAGYWHMPDETGKAVIDGWLHTGDMAYYDERGYIYIVDRKKDMIITGGENVYPRDVEEVLYRHPAVLECAVIGVPDEKWVERVHAVIVLKQGQQVTDGEIMEFCKERIARYKAPRSVEFVIALPKNPQGKILKRELREKYWQGRSRNV
ncbi:MAG: Long-chain-fatty-acid--CoA ligase [Syntrophorhabdaceae bacterium PtaU1.Bin034]|jgi:acyl-CoA synthetase (AMP-forming)/AMP-acid ligase II|nr:MAG: Long-chain-fatty-acid--CoA ligase [Syntrophorhabdaceae bacterium PtaU1.Bin034]